MFGVMMLFLIFLFGCESKEFKEHKTKAETYINKKEFIKAKKEYELALVEEPENEEVITELNKVKKEIKKLKKKTMETYYNSLLDRDYDTAYSLLSAETKLKVNKDDFELVQFLDSEQGKDKSFEIKETDNDNNFKVTIHYEDYYTGRDDSMVIDRKVVIENNVVKVDRTDIDIDEKLSSGYYLVGQMYLEGKGKEEDFYQAAAYFKLAIKYNEKDDASYFGLGYCYNQLERYDDSIEAYDEAIKYSDKENTEAISYTYSNNASNYLAKGDTKKAISLLNKALELFPDNEYAKTTLNGL